MNIQKYLRVPYVIGGRAWDGADCYGLLKLFYAEERGVDLAVFENEYTDVVGAKQFIEEHLYDQWRVIPREEIREGDPVTFWHDDQQSSVHVGILIDRCRSMLTTFKDTGVHVITFDAAPTGQFLLSRVSEYLRYVSG